MPDLCIRMITKLSSHSPTSDPDLRGKPDIQALLDVLGDGPKFSPRACPQPGVPKEMELHYNTSSWPWTGFISTCKK